MQQREEYKSARRHVKRLIRLEKKGLRKATIEWIREQGGLAVSYFGWT